MVGSFGNKEATNVEMIISALGANADADANTGFSAIRAAECCRARLHIN